MITSAGELLRQLAVIGVSDIHLKAMRPPLQRIGNELIPVKSMEPLSVKDTEAIAREILAPDAWDRLTTTLECDSSYSLPGFCRFRVSAFRQRGSLSLVLRIIPFTIPTLDELKVPAILKDLALSENGLILVTGATGSGKSSSLAGMINHINQTRHSHIITIEDPIEFLYKDNLSSINQREISIDTHSFANAFRAALRQDPDVIMVGELRDLETMEIALKAVETGHLVLATLHTTDAKETISRFIDSFPPFQQNQVRFQLAANLRAVVSQRLLERKDGTGRVLAAEIMIANASIREFIQDPAKTQGILANMEKEREQYGSQTFDQALMDLYRHGDITETEAVSNATSPNDFRLKINLG